MSLQFNKHRLTDPTKVHCVGCGQEISIVFAYCGRKYTRTSFKEIEKEETIYNLVTRKLETTSHTVTVPIMGWVKGILCSECANDYGVIEHRDGSWTPKVKLESKPRERTSINPGYIPERTKSEPETTPVDFRTPVKGPGKLIWDPLTKWTRQEVN